MHENLINTMKKIFLISLIVMLIGALSALYIYTQVYNKPHINIYESQADFNVAAVDLIADFESDEQNANQRYLDRIVQVNGTIRNIETVNGLSVITLGNDNELAGVICNMDPTENKEVLGLEVGQTLEAKGICTGYLLDVIIVRAVIIDQT